MPFLVPPLLRLLGETTSQLVKAVLESGLFKFTLLLILLTNCLTLV